MKRSNLYKNLYYILAFISFIVWIILPKLSGIPLMKIRLYRGITGSLLLVIGLILSYIHAKINHIKNPFYDPDKKKHFRNWVIVILSLVLTVIIVAFVYLKFF